jgi:monoamine oxidase
MKTTAKRVDVLVVGAGVSGLACARQLADDDWSVTVLEARDRVGGRVWSNRAWPGLALDMGAGWLEGDEGNPITEIVERERITSVVFDEDTEYLYRSDGTEVSDRDWDAQSERFDKLMRDLDALRKKRIRERQPDLSMQSAIEHVLHGANLTAAQRAELDYHVTREIENDYAADSSELSLYHWDLGDEFDGDDRVFPGGYDQVPKALAKGLDVRLSHVVSKVERGEDGVRVTTDKGVFEADYAVIAVPLGVLKKGSIEFVPPLPARKKQAIERLGMGVLNRVYLRFSKVFWEREAHGWGVIPRRPDEWTEYVNFVPFVREPILLCFNSGKYARQVEKLTEEQIVAGMMDTLRSVFGPEIPAPTAALITRWSQDPFAYGSYSYMAVGSTPEDVEALAAPVEDTVFFAGEATESEYGATVHGAILAGRRAADEIDEADEA